jgi:putative peptidoglycan lipid II flippase
MRPATNARVPEPAVPSSDTIVADSVAGSLATAVSRLSGFAQSVTVGAVLGATYLGNTYLAVNGLPNIVYYQLLAGSLFAALLVPPLVRHLDAGEHAAAKRLIDGFYGAMLILAGGLAVLLVLAGPLVMRLLTLGVSDAAAAQAQRHVGMVLLIVFAPQIALYATAGTGAAVMNARGRFALAAAAPALENLVMIAVLIACGVIYGTGTSITQVSDAELLLLGIGTTLGVGLHAAAQWFGARSVGIVMVPRAGWSDPEVRAVLKRIVPTLALTGLAALQVFGVFVVADRVAGGLVAFQLALSFFFLPVALVTWPVARAMLPPLARLHRDGDRAGFDGELVRAVSLVSFVTVPAAVAFVVLSVPIARAVTFSELATPAGVRMVALSLAALALGVVAESWFIVATDACYARQDVHTPLRSMIVRVLVTFVCAGAAWMLPPEDVLLGLGASLSVGAAAATVHLWVRLGVGVPAPLRRSLRHAALATVPMALVVALIGGVLGSAARGAIAEIAVVLGASAAGGLVYFGIQRSLGSPDLHAFLGSFATLRTRVAERHDG